MLELLLISTQAAAISSTPSQLSVFKNIPTADTKSTLEMQACVQGLPRCLPKITQKLFSDCEQVRRFASSSPLCMSG
jgi:hypothetical protein